MVAHSIQRQWRAHTPMQTKPERTDEEVRESYAEMSTELFLMAMQAAGKDNLRSDIAFELAGVYYEESQTYTSEPMAE